MSTRVLVIEDNEDNRQIFHDLFTAAGFDVTLVATGEEGVERAAEHAFDVVLMDLQLPGIDGYETTRRIKALAHGAKVPIIAVTSYALSGDEAKARAAGCDGYVSKPFSPRALLATVREYLA
jgi:two-component system cell cycle response regulator DivK